jgi:hypothetical protein
VFDADDRCLGHGHSRIILFRPRQEEAIDGSSSTPDEPDRTVIPDSMELAAAVSARGYKALEC